MTTMTVERALQWAYRDELPKRQEHRGDGLRSSAGTLASVAELMAVVDVNRYGVVPDLATPGGEGPDPDAVRIAKAVAALADFEPDLPEGWFPWGDCPAVTPDHAAELTEAVRGRLFSPSGRLRCGLVSTVVHHAILGGEPDWRIGVAPRRAMMTTKNGQPMWFVARGERIVDLGGVTVRVETVWTEGYDPVGKRPFPGAVRRETWDHKADHPAELGERRAIWQLWRMALAEVAAGYRRAVEADRAAGDAGAGRISLRLVDRPACPWMEPEPVRRVWAGGLGTPRRGA